ncbi:MAG: ABC transporter permease [Terriglobales bacterium]
MMTGLTQDLRYALRQLRRSPGFTTTAVLTLALGIGANTAIFTVVNTLLLKMLPVRDPEQLVVVGDPELANTRSNGTPRTDIFSYPLYKEFRDHSSVFTGLCAAATDHGVEVKAGDGSASDDKALGRMVSGNYFNVLGLQAAMGRLFSNSDDTAENANPVAVLGFGYWQRKFAQSSTIIGKDIRLNGYPFTVVGVAPAGFDGDVVGETMAVYVPLSMQQQVVRGRHWREAENVSWLALIGRLKPGVSTNQAAANLNVVFRQAMQGGYGAALSDDDRDAIRNAHINVSPGGGGISELRAEYRVPMMLLMGIVGLVLLIAAVNVANLLLARASVRRKEIAIRLAIGATRRRVLQQLLTESVLLALCGGIAGSLLAVWSIRALLTTMGTGNLHNLPLLPDWHVLTFASLISLLTGVLFGLFPALRTMEIRVSPTLKDGSRATAENRSRVEWGKALIVGQVALSLMVLFAAGLLVHSLQKLLTQDFGYTRDHLIIARVDPIAAGYKPASMKSLAQQLVAGLAGTPGVRAVTYSVNGLFAGTESSDTLLVPGFTATDMGGRSANEDYVGPDYFGVVGIPLLAGRGITEQDTQTSTRVAVVNEAMVKHFFRGQDPIGRQFMIDDVEWRDKPLTIVGVSHDAKDHGSGIREAVRPRFYLAFQQISDPTQIVLEAQVSGTPSVALTNVRNQIKTADPQLPISFVKALDSLVSDSAANQIALAKLSSSFAGLALMLACIGLYGVMSYKVAGRTREIGVRMALGAKRTDVVQLVLREAMLLVTIGLALGIPLALASGRVLRTFLYGLNSTDPLSMLSVVLLLGIVAAFAGFIPARRAAKVEPTVALRYE